MASSLVSLSVVVPVHNELGNLEPLTQRLRTVLEQLGGSWELIFVDDGSNDGSGELLDSIAAPDDRISVLHLVENSGQSAALDAGFQASRGEVVAMLDADLQVYPEDLPELVRSLDHDGVDAVIGIRTERRDGWWRRLSSRFANWIRNLLTGDDIVDTCCPLKVFRGEAIRAVPMFDGMHRFLPTLLRLQGCRVCQRPVRHAARQAGRSKYGTWQRAWRGMTDVLAVRWMMRRKMRWRIR